MTSSHDDPLAWLRAPQSRDAVSNSQRSRRIGIQTVPIISFPEPLGHLSEYMLTTTCCLRQHGNSLLGLPSFVRNMDAAVMQNSNIIPYTFAKACSHAPLSRNRTQYKRRIDSVAYDLYVPILAVQVPSIVRKDRHDTIEFGNQV